MTRCLVLAVVAAFVAAGHALAQAPSPYKPAPAAPQKQQFGPTPVPQPSKPAQQLPWERDAERYFNRQMPDPGAAGLKKMYDDPLAKFGLPPNVPPSSLTPRRPVRPPPASLPPEAGRLDANRDGAVTRNEYLGARTRTPSVLGPAPSLREQTLNSRHNNRFRNADRNGDGVVTPDEYNAAPNSRF